MKRTDPATYEPSVPRVMRVAADLVRKHGSILGDQQDRLVERLNQVANPRAEREIRSILSAHRDVAPAKTAQALLEGANELRLKPARPVERPPQVGLEDIRLVTWMAIVGGN
jgi:hypothetical protein